VEAVKADARARASDSINELRSSGVTSAPSET
jgi:hypothetical protein